MKKEAIKKYIYAFWEKDFEDVKERKINMDFLKTDLINDIVGVRRCGKTNLMYLIAKKGNFIYLNCEDRLVYPLKLEDLNYLIEFIYEENLLKKPVFLMLDEIQTVEKWEVFAKSIYDEFKGRVKLIVSGSVKLLLSKDYGKLLTGRHKSIELFPLSFKEFLAFKGFSNFERITEEKEAKIRKFAEEYLKHGSFPKYILTDDFSYLEEGFNDIIERDIKSRVEVRKKEVIDELTGLFIERIGTLVSFTKMRNILRNKGYKVSTDLVIRYSSIFETVFLFFFLPIYSPKYSEVIKNPKKIYCVDNGFFKLFYLNFSENSGKLMENTVAIELLKRGYKTGKDLFYAKVDGKEVDFVLKKGLKIKQLIQVCYSLEDYNTKEREIKSLLKASKELKCNNLLIISWDEEDEIKEKGKNIKVVPLWKWLVFD